MYPIKGVCVCVYCIVCTRSCVQECVCGGCRFILDVLREDHSLNLELTGCLDWLANELPGSPGHLNSGLLVYVKSTLSTEPLPYRICLFFCLSEAYQFKCIIFAGVSMGDSVPRAALTLQKPGRG